MAKAWRRSAVAGFAVWFAASAASAQAPAVAPGDDRPYDAQIHRLAEILGAVHYLRELCGQDEGQTWRDQMRELVNAEGSSALRKARLVENFNKGYRGYARTYRTCNRSAIIAINRFMEQGAAITNVLIQDNR
ncbi:MAG: TIGR02301 family protein [Hyphomicrobiales bacterium]|nr:TIGR02301 family protein [Hyphomicrobiales bacterium]